MEEKDMPIIIVYGVPEKMSQNDLEKFCKNLMEATAHVKELNLKPGHVTVFFPTDRLKAGLGEEIIIFVKGLFDTTERTPEVRKKLATKIMKVAHNTFADKCNLVECFVEPFNPNNGFASFPRISL